jgi:hypothetical protein
MHLISFESAIKAKIISGSQKKPGIFQFLSDSRRSERLPWTAAMPFVLVLSIGLWILIIMAIRSYR